ncbi:uncharacterized protein LAESUDRAFT_759623 [Laetiporus sulphureus 93-53]|uniref:Uncharacterized protein n=1 Tax=Laetiporus sulphureus 93-53 TaxID=1314785 RepID=A0A165E1Z4_9APHY|nr:uncharacterized protein LAESUDRAFT_759623 [Laetiporus sulphureus 93-53]KZT06092.1 hypothetical protein LAESUDRAFT_759623 [Laetiporus sulphureus 93-53]
MQPSDNSKHSTKATLDLASTQGAAHQADLPASEPDKGETKATTTLSIEESEQPKMTRKPSSSSVGPDKENIVRKQKRVVPATDSVAQREIPTRSKRKAADMVEGTDDIDHERLLKRLKLGSHNFNETTDTDSENEVARFLPIPTCLLTKITVGVDVESRTPTKKSDNDPAQKDILTSTSVRAVSSDLDSSSVRKEKSSSEPPPECADGQDSPIKDHRAVSQSSVREPTPKTSVTAGKESLQSSTASAVSNTEEGAQVTASEEIQAVCDRSDKICHEDVGADKPSAEDTYEENDESDAESSSSDPDIDYELAVVTDSDDSDTDSDDDDEPVDERGHDDDPEDNEPPEAIEVKPNTFQRRTEISIWRYACIYRIEPYIFEYRDRISASVEAEEKRYQARIRGDVSKEHVLKPPEFWRIPLTKINRDFDIRPDYKSHGTPARPPSPARGIVARRSLALRCPP